jgi:DNA repair exonuclease SbcCD nuclease subunit
MSEQENKPVRIVILSKAFGAKWETAFFEEIEAAILDGYRIARTCLRDDASMRNFRGRIGKCVMYKEGHEPEAWKPAEVVETPEIDTAKLKEDVKELSTSVQENTPVDSEKKDAEDNTAEADAAKLAKEQEEAEKVAAEKKATSTAKMLATRLANKLAKEAEKQDK